MDPNVVIKIDRGRISPLVEVPDLIVRRVTKKALIEGLDGADQSDALADDSEEDGFEYRVQGRVINISSANLSKIDYDVSYYGSKDEFLGLDKSRYLDEDELEKDDHLPIDMRVEIPSGTARCVFNIRAKKAE